MKKLGILFKAFSVVVVCASCALLLEGCIVKTSGIESINTNESFEYGNINYGFTLSLSEDFSDHLEVVEDENIIYFTNKEIRTANPEAILGVVGRIEVYEKDQFTEADILERNEAYNLKVIGENEKYYFGWAPSTDVQYPPNVDQEIKDEYNAMVIEFNVLIDTFKTTES